MARYIDIDEVFIDPKTISIPWEEALLMVKQNVAPIVHAKWEICSPKNSFQKIRCTNCKTPSDCIWKYCPNCGAIMDKE